MGKLPPVDFLGLGAQRCGTSWLYACLSEHPEICMPRKEINFFNHEEKWSRGVDRYRKHFTECSHDQLRGEISTSYLHTEGTPRRIHETVPDARLLVVLRDPVQRAYSGFRNDIDAGNLPKDARFEDQFEDGEYLERSRYAKHLANYLTYFDRDQLWVGRFERIRSEPDALLEDAFEFLGVDKHFEPTFRNKTVNPRRNPIVPGLEPLLNELAKPFRSRRWLRPIWWVLKKAGVGEAIRGLNSSDKPRRGLREQTERRLRERLLDEVEKLEALFSMDLDDWKPSRGADKS